MEINAKIDLKTTIPKRGSQAVRTRVRFVRTSEFLDDLHSDIEYFRYLCLANIAICGEMLNRVFIRARKIT